LSWLLLLRREQRLWWLLGRLLPKWLELRWCL
jgi:hypothetical protein